MKHILATVLTCFLVGGLVLPARAAENPEEFQEELNHSIETYKDQLQDLKNQLENDGKKVNAKRREMVKRLDYKLEQLQDRYEEIRETSEKNWSELKEQAQKARDDFQKSYDDTASRISKK